MSEARRADAEGDPSFPGEGARPWAEPADPVGEPESAPFLGPYIGLVSGVLCALVGAFLLLAPYAFDYRHGAASVPRSSVVDLATGAAVLVLGFVTAGLFGATLVRRLRAPEPVRRRFAEPEPEPVEPPELFLEPELEPAPEPVRAPEPQPVAPPAAPAAAPAIDAAGALRDLLTPLVAALAADLRARDEGEKRPGGPSEKD
ncbi:hypothetical protein [Actinospica robiniae]|uniref:hypothetical protein n=1 Tax=Actinospica robiniae TaxID=304901 RepID=UPI0012F8F6AD|nr:hypothetical protein [Actinospica robiniae]